MKKNRKNKFWRNLQNFFFLDFSIVPQSFGEFSNTFQEVRGILQNFLIVLELFFLLDFGMVSQCFGGFSETFQEFWRILRDCPKGITQRPNKIVRRLAYLCMLENQPKLYA